VNHETKEPAGDVRVSLSKDEALVVYDWLARHFELDEQHIRRQHGLIGEICADLWSQIFGMSPLPDGVYEEQLKKAFKHLETKD
jgi:hypothetical protein